MLSSPEVTIGRLPEQGCHEAVMRLIALTFNTRPLGAVQH